MANEFIIKHGFHSKGNSQLTGSLNVSVTSSAAVFSGSTYYGDGSNLTGIVASNWTSSGDGITRGNGTVQITGSVIISSSLTVTELTASNIGGTFYPKHQVEYFIPGVVTASGTTVPLPNNLTFHSSSGTPTYEYLEIFINGLRLRYDMDFIPQSTASVAYQITIPSGSEVTYKSLKRP